MRWISIVAIVSIALLGCSLEDALEGAPCNSVDDCVGEQACIKSSENSVGVCSSNGGGDGGGECAAGQQDGCIVASDGTCENFMYVTCAADDQSSCFCCAEYDSRVTHISEDMRSAECVSCPTDLCYGNAASEICVDGDARCELADDAVCGCRIPANQIENSECDDATTCGSGFVCTRTLEQESEPDEALPEEQREEPGWCRPDDETECVSGFQEGCRTESGCQSGSERCAGTRCYCCNSPANTTDFDVHVYAQTSMGESAACVDCPKQACIANNTSACTLLENPDCIVSSGVCGCTPPPM